MGNKKALLGARLLWLGRGGRGKNEATCLLMLVYRNVADLMSLQSTLHDLCKVVYKSQTNAMPVSGTDST
jgi:hypothetical protein